MLFSDYIWPDRPPNREKMIEKQIPNILQFLDPKKEGSSIEKNGTSTAMSVQENKKNIKKTRETAISSATWHSHGDLTSPPSPDHSAADMASMQRAEASLCTPTLQHSKLSRSTNLEEQQVKKLFQYFNMTTVWFESVW